MSHEVTTENHGSLILVRPHTFEARDWLEEMTDGEWFADALVVEPRYLGPLVEGMVEAGFTVG